MTSFNRKELENYANNNVAFSGLNIARISSVLIAQIYNIERDGEFDMFGPLDEIKYLEGIYDETHTAKPKHFTGKILKDYNLQKKHFMDAKFILENIINHLGIKKGNSKNWNKIYNQALENNKSGYFDAKFANFLGHHATIGAFNNRAKSKNRLTGEWIVFKEHKGENYYLSLAVHNDDENILNHVKIAYEFDFEFLA